MVLAPAEAPINANETPCQEHMQRGHCCNAQSALFRLTCLIQITDRALKSVRIRFGKLMVRRASVMSEIRVPGNRLRLSELFKRAPKASLVSREDEEQHIVDGYLRGLNNETLDRIGYSAEQIDRLRHGKSVRLSA